MALTLSELKEMTNSLLAQMVIDETRKSNYILQNIPFDSNTLLDGSGSWTYSYRRVTTKPSAGTRALNADYTASEAKVTKYSVDLKIMGGSFEIDRASLNKQFGVDNLDFQIAQKIEAVSALFNDLFINGDEGADATQFDGLDAALTGSTTEYNAAGTAIDLSSQAAVNANAEQFRYEFRQWLKSLDKKPTFLACNRDLKTQLMAVQDYFARNTETRDSMAQVLPTFMEIPVVDLGEKPGSSNPVIATTATETSLYAVYLGLDGVHGVAPEDTSRLIKTYIPRFEDGDDAVAVKKGAVEMIATIAMKATRSAGVFRKIQVA